MNTRRITLIVAVVLAIGTGILTLRYLTSIQQQAATTAHQAESELRPIVIASRDIPARAKITADMLTRISRPAAQVEPGAVDNPAMLNGYIALISIPMGSTLTETKVGKPGAVGLTVQLKPGMRAISIPVDRVKAVSGLLQPGDHVDVLAAVPKVQGSQPKAVTIIRGALVLAINNHMETAGATPDPDGDNLLTVTLGVTPDQADLLTMADLNTTLRLALRPANEGIRSLAAETLYFPDQSSSGGPSQPGPVYPMAAAPLPPSVSVPPVQAAPPAVTVIDGDRIVSAAR